MRYPNWLYLILVTGWTGGLTLLLIFLIFDTFRGYSNYSDFYSFSLELALAPYLISLTTAKLFLSRRYNSPEQRKLLNSILLSLAGIVLLLSGVFISFSSSFLDPAGTLIGLIGFIVVLHGFSLAFPGNRDGGVLQEDSTLAGHLNPLVGESGGYLPAAGVATLLATILTSLITGFGPFEAVFVLGFSSAIGVVTGIACSASLLKGKYQLTVPLGLLFLPIPSLVSLVLWPNLFLLAIPIIALCASSIGLIVWNQRNSMKVSGWRALGILSAGISAIALVLGTLQFSYDQCNSCLTWCFRPYLNNAGLLLSLAATGTGFALISMDSARINSVKPTVILPAKIKKEKRSMLFQVSIVLLIASLASTTLFSAAVISSSLNRWNFSGYTMVDQLNITNATFGPSENQTTFSLANSGTLDVKINYVTVQGGNITNSVYASQLSTSTICVGPISTLLVATFPGVTFVKGTIYSFKLLSSRGDTFPYSATA